VPASRNSAFVVTVHQVRENITLTLSLEDYVLGVISAEGSIEDEPEALKALAIAARTSALKNIRRHKSQGYDFCTTTHCQRFVVTEGINLAKSRTPFVTAVRDTAGLVLEDDQGHIAESYFGASCGGMTANLETLWGVNSPPYLRGVRDEYCTTAPHHAWTDVISSDELAQALRSDPRTDVGGTIHRLLVTRRDQTGRAESITIEGERLRTINGWEFKLIVGRVLGWNRLKSSRFSIVRSGSNFVFHGRGFGHGLGLCQEGSHVMAQQGFGYRQILAKYFPGTTVRCRCPICFISLSLTLAEVLVAQNDKLKHIGYQNPGRQGASFRRESHADLLWEVSFDASLLSTSKSKIPNPKLAASPPRRFSTSPRRSLSSEHFRVNYPQTGDARDVSALLRILETNRSSLLQRLPSASPTMEFPYLQIFINETTGDFVGRTGQPSWAAAATRDRRIELQPLALLQRLGILETTIRHELVHIMIDKLGSGRTPRWLAEGMALSLAGEGPVIQRYQPAYKMSPGELERKLVSANSVEEMRTAYAAAYAAVQYLIKTEGESSVWQLVARGKNGKRSLSATRD
jgi:SpoIID/LytB domain protein